MEASPDGGAARVVCETLRAVGDAASASAGVAESLLSLRGESVAGASVAQMTAVLRASIDPSLAQAAVTVPPVSVGPTTSTSLTSPLLARAALIFIETYIE